MKATETAAAPSLRAALIQIFAERLLDFRTLPSTVKWAVYVSGTVLIVNAGLIATYDAVAGPRVELGTGLGLRLGAIVLGAGFGLLAVSVFLSGLFISSSRVRFWVVGAVAVTYFLLAGLPMAVRIEMPWGLVGGLLLAGVPIAFFVILPIVARTMRLLALAGSVALALYAMSLGYIAASTQTGDPWAPDVLLMLLLFGGVAGYPLFLSAAADFAELGDAVADALNRALFAHLHLWLAGVGATALCAANIWLFAWPALSAEADRATVIDFAGRGLTLAAFAGLLFLALRRGAIVHPHIRIPVIVGVSTVFLMLTALAEIITEDAPPPVFNHRLQPVFSVITPEDWTGRVYTADDWSIQAAAALQLGKELPIVTVVSIETAAAEPLTRINDLLEGGERLPETPMPEPATVDDRGWSKFETTMRYPPDREGDNVLHIVGWRKKYENAFNSRLNRDWYVVGVVRSDGLAVALPKFEGIRDSLRFLLRKRQSEMAANGFLIVLAGIAVTAAAFLFLSNAAMKYGAEVAFIALTAGFAFLHGLLFPAAAQTLGNLELEGTLLISVSLVVALASALCALFVSIVRPRTLRPVLGAVLSLNLSFLVLAGLFYAFRSLAELGSDYDWLKALAALATIGWDVFVAGGAFTNGDSPTFPRTSRLLMQLGFTQLVAALVFLYFPGTMRGIEMTGFEPDLWVATGVVAVGVPLVLALWCVRLARGDFRTSQGAATSVVSEPR